MNAHVQPSPASAPLSLSASEVDAAVTAAFSQLGHVASNGLKLDPERVQHDLARLVLALVEFLRRLLELQAIRRMEAGSLTADEEERIGTTLMLARERLLELADGFGLKPSDLNLDLGPLGRLC
jgi:hypothetical protein